jgi:hypothetical protein
VSVENLLAAARIINVGLDELVDDARAAWNSELLALAAALKESERASSRIGPVRSSRAALRWVPEHGSSVADPRGVHRLVSSPSAVLGELLSLPHGGAPLPLAVNFCFQFNSCG